MQTLPYWSWSEGQGCPPDNSLSCFFVGAERLCHQRDNSSEIVKAANDLPMEDAVPAPEYVSVDHLCGDLITPYGGVAAYRAASTEFLFTRVATFVQDEAERQRASKWALGSWARKAAFTSTLGASQAITSEMGNNYSSPQAERTTRQRILFIHVRCLRRARRLH
jgi:hypothetical protein